MMNCTSSRRAVIPVASVGSTLVCSRSLNCSRAKMWKKFQKPRAPRASRKPRACLQLVAELNQSIVTVSISGGEPISTPQLLSEIDERCDVNSGGWCVVVGGGRKWWWWKVVGGGGGGQKVGRGQYSSMCVVCEVE